MTSALKWLEISSRNNLGVFFSFCFPLPTLRNSNAFLISPAEATGYSHHWCLHLVHCLAWFSEQSSEVQTAIFIVPVLWLQRLGLDDIKRFLVCFPVSRQAVVNGWDAALSAHGACLLLATSPSSTQRGADPCPRSEQTAEHPQAPVHLSGALTLAHFPTFCYTSVELTKCANGSLSSIAQVLGGGVLSLNKVTQELKRREASWLF